MLTYLFNRLKEPSTMAGLGIIGYVATHAASILAVATTPQSALLAGLGLLATVMPEGGSPAAQSAPVKS